MLHTQSQVTYFQTCVSDGEEMRILSELRLKKYFLGVGKSFNVVGGTSFSTANYHLASLPAIYTSFLF